MRLSDAGAARELRELRPVYAVNASAAAAEALSASFLKWITAESPEVDAEPHHITHSEYKTKATE